MKFHAPDMPVYPSPPSPQLAILARALLHCWAISTFEGLGNEAGWFALGGSSIVERLAQLLNVMAVHHNGMPAKGLHACSVGFHVVFQGSWLALAQSG